MLINTDTLPFALAEKAQPRDQGGWNHFTGFIVIFGLGGRLYMKLQDKLTD
jgi:hypothetical protein